MIRIDASGIGIKTPIRVDEKMKKVKATFQYQSTVIKQGKPQGDNQIDRAVNYYDSQVKSIDEMTNYIIDMLDLDNKQIKKLDNAAFPEVMKLSSQIVAKMLHYDEGNNDPKAGKK